MNYDYRKDLAKGLGIKDQGLRVKEKEIRVRDYCEKKTNLKIRNSYPFPLKAVLGIFV